MGPKTTNAAGEPGGRSDGEARSWMKMTVLMMATAQAHSFVLLKT